jgi:hypothetical protein
MIPSWGTPPETPELTRYTVVGFYEDSGQRFCHHVEASSPRTAEDATQSVFGGQTGEDGQPCGLRVCGVLAIVNGAVEAVDTYAEFLDPDEVRLA